MVFGCVFGLISLFGGFGCWLCGYCGFGVLLVARYFCGRVLYLILGVGL